MPCSNSRSLTAHQLLGLLLLVQWRLQVDPSRYVSCWVCNAQQPARALLMACCVRRHTCLQAMQPEDVYMVSALKQPEPPNASQPADVQDRRVTCCLSWELRN